jgi:4-amino-4-deoxy-L-arabinose transferase-like glycosyltransferase
MKFIKSHYWLIAVLIFSAFLNLWNQDFPIEFHADEQKKVRFVLQNTQDFMHPTLLLQVSRLSNYFLDFTERTDIVHIGRTVSAISGILIVLFSYLISQLVFEKKSKYFTALACAVSPILVIHAHYFKEDMLFTAFFTMSLFALLKFLKAQNFKTTIFLGLSIGLAISSKYVAALIIPITLIAPLIYRSENKREIYLSILKSFAISFLVFLIVNYPLTLDFKTFWSGLTYEIDHVIKGHEISGYSSSSKTNTYIAITPFEFWFTFHLRYSLINGMTLPIVLMGALGIFITLWTWNKTKNEEKLILISLFLLYFAAECSPTKPFPDFMRYMIPVVPLLLCFAGKCFDQLLNKKNLKLVVLPLITLFIGYCLWDSSLLLYNLKDDTRRDAIAWLKQNSMKVKGEMYTMCDNRVASLALLDLEKERSEGTEFFVASNFFYDRILFAKKLKKCPNNILEVHQQYTKLFALPYIEFKPKHRSFAFSNPTIRIINIKEENHQSLCTKSEALLSIQFQKQGERLWAKMLRKS